LGKIPVGALPLVLFNKSRTLAVVGVMKLEGSVEIAEAAGLYCWMNGGLIC
jgi:hypothetical protein